MTSATAATAESEYSIFQEACWTQTILFLLYSFTIVRSLCTVRLNFVVGIAALLATTCLTWIIECYFKYLYVSTSGADNPCFSQVDPQAK
jgi:hypothetical protein